MSGLLPFGQYPDGRLVHLDLAPGQEVQLARRTVHVAADGSTTTTDELVQVGRRQLVVPPAPEPLALPAGPSTRRRAVDPVEVALLGIPASAVFVLLGRAYWTSGPLTIAAVVVLVLALVGVVALRVR